MKKVMILGSTGSIGTQALDVIGRLPEEFCVTALAADKNWELMARQARAFRPEVCAMRDPEAARKLRESCPGLRVEEGDTGVEKLALEAEADLALVAVVGIAGLPLVLACLERGVQVALANKEALVTGGHIVMPLAAEKGLPILPVDSEHSAIFQCLMASNDAGREAERLILTASGGPFFGKTREELRHVTPEAALKHPNWSMGAKVTVDSAGLVNKGLEVIEARWLFDMPPEKIDVLVHPQSIVHSMVEFADGAVIAQMSPPDMRLPIQLALTWPRRTVCPMPRLRLEERPALTFALPDRETFPALDLAYEALREQNGRTIVYNAADEIASRAFLTGKIGFLEIPELLKRAVHEVPYRPFGCAEEVFALDRETRSFCERCLSAR